MTAAPAEPGGDRSGSASALLGGQAPSGSARRRREARTRALEKKLKALRPVGANEKEEQTGGNVEEVVDVSEKREKLEQAAESGGRTHEQNAFEEIEGDKDQMWAEDSVGTIGDMFEEEADVGGGRKVNHIGYVYDAVREQLQKAGDRVNADDLRDWLHRRVDVAFDVWLGIFRMNVDERDHTGKSLIEGVMEQNYWHFERIRSEADERVRKAKKYYQQGDRSELRSGTEGSEDASRQSTGSECGAETTSDEGAWAVKRSDG